MRALVDRIRCGAATHTALLSFLLFFPTLATVWAQPRCEKREETTTFGKWLAPNFSIQSESNDPFWPYSPGYIGFEPASMRLLLRLERATTRQWVLTLRDHNYRVLASLGPSDFEELSSGRAVSQRWTTLLANGEVLFNLHLYGQGNVELKVVSGIAYPAQAEGVRLFSTQSSTPNWQSLYQSNFERAKQVGNVVGMLVTGAEGGAGKSSWCCSGVLVSPTLFLTNWHCGGSAGIVEDDVWHSDVCQNALVDMAWDDGAHRRQFGCKEVLARNRPLDFALLRLTPLVGGSTGQLQHATLADAPVSRGDDIFLVHHAACKPKLISGACRVVASSRAPWRLSAGGVGDTALGSDLAPDFTHTCDTEAGSSGAPVFSSSGEVVGLHHLGFEPVSERGCALDQLNKATKIGQILEVLERDAPHVFHEIQHSKRTQQ